MACMVAKHLHKAHSFTPNRTLIKNQLSRSKRNHWLKIKPTIKSYQPKQGKRILLRQSDDPSNEEIESTAQQPTTSQDEIIEKESSIGLFNKLINKKSAQNSKEKTLNFRIEDSELVLYDVFLLLNLSVSVSVWVVHRKDPLNHLLSAIGEGSLLCLLWVSIGLINGLFLYSAIDGHYNPDENGRDGKIDDENNGGPRAAGWLAFNTFVSVINVRLFIALVEAVTAHRRIGDIDQEGLMTLESIFGLVLMSSWRMLHSSYILR